MPYTPPTNTSTPTSSPVPSEGTAGKGSSVDLKKERDEIRARLTVDTKMPVANTSAVKAPALGEATNQLRTPRPVLGPRPISTYSYAPDFPSALKVGVSPTSEPSDKRSFSQPIAVTNRSTSGLPVPTRADTVAVPYRSPPLTLSATVGGAEDLRHVPEVREERKTPAGPRPLQKTGGEEYTPERISTPKGLEEEICRSSNNISPSFKAFCSDTLTPTPLPPTTPTYIPARPTPPSLTIPSFPNFSAQPRKKSPLANEYDYDQLGRLAPKQRTYTTYRPPAGTRHSIAIPSSAYLSPPTSPPAHYRHSLIPTAPQPQRPHSSQSHHSPQQQQHSVVRSTSSQTLSPTRTYLSPNDARPRPMSPAAAARLSYYEQPPPVQRPINTHQYKLNTEAFRQSQQQLQKTKSAPEDDGKKKNVYSERFKSEWMSSLQSRVVMPILPPGASRSVLSFCSTPGVAKREESVEVEQGDGGGEGKVGEEGVDGVDGEELRVRLLGEKMERLETEKVEGEEESDSASLDSTNSSVSAELPMKVEGVAGESVVGVAEMGEGEKMEVKTDSEVIEAGSGPKSTTPRGTPPPPPPQQEFLDRRTSLKTSPKQQDASSPQQQDSQILAPSASSPQLSRSSSSSSPKPLSISSQKSQPPKSQSPELLSDQSPPLQQSPKESSTEQDEKKDPTDMSSFANFINPYNAERSQLRTHGYPERSYYQVRSMYMREHDDCSVEELISVAKGRVAGDVETHSLLCDAAHLHRRVLRDHDYALCALSDRLSASEFHKNELEARLTDLTTTANDDHELVVQLERAKAKLERELREARVEKERAQEELRFVKSGGKEGGWRKVGRKLKEWRGRGEEAA